MSAKSQYKTLLKSGILLELYPELIGEWDSDKHEFEKIWEVEQSFTNNLDVEDDYEQF